MACRQDTLDEANVEAWNLYQRLHSRFAADLQLVPDLFRALVDGWPAEDIAEVIARLTVMYDVFNPPKEPE